MIDLDYLWCCVSPNFHASDCSLLVHLSAFSSLNIISCGYHYTLHIQLSLSSHFLTTRPTYSDRSIGVACMVCVTFWCRGSESACDFLDLFALLLFPLRLSCLYHLYLCFKLSDAYQVELAFIWPTSCVSAHSKVYHSICFNSQQGISLYSPRMPSLR